MLKRLVRAAKRVLDWCDRYYQWYQRSPWGDWNLPRCPFCNAHRRSLRWGSHRLVNSRYRSARVIMGVRCTECGATMTATRKPWSKGWSYYDYE